MNIVTATPFDSVVPSTLKDIIAHDVARNGPFKFRCIARAVKRQPEVVEEIVKKRGWKYVYMLQLVLEDSTGKLPALLYEQDAEEFFHGIPPVDFKSNNVSKKAIESQFKLIFDEGAWLNCCIKKYQSESGKINYRMFGTSIRP